MATQAASWPLPLLEPVALISGAFSGCNEAPTPPHPPPDLLEQHEGERLHQAVEGLLRDALGVAALQAQSPGISTALRGSCLPQAARASSASPRDPTTAGRWAESTGGRASLSETAVCLSELFFSEIGRF